MARAYGSSAHLLMKRETVYGQAATGNYIRLPFNRCNLGSEQGLIDDPVLGQGRDPLAPLQDVINDEGDIVVPVDPRYPISRQEHEAWDVLLACQSQLRLAPSGHVAGIDMDAALTLAAAQGYDLVVLSGLLPTADAGLVEALCSDRVRDDGP